MTGSRIEIPSIGSLLAFEAVARLGGVGRAARERNTSQPAISRHIRNLERTLGFSLFRRSGRGLALTDSGKEYFKAVQASVERLDATAGALRTGQTGLTIGCTLEFSGLVLLPVFSRLKRFLGERVAARVVTYDHDMLALLVPAGLDIVFEASFAAALPDRDAVRILDEEIVPVASPAFLERHRAVLARHPRNWRGVPRLDIGRPGPGWATWETWFGAHGCMLPDAPVETFENYFHLLRAAADGDGIAMGWNGFITDYVRAGQLVVLRDEWLRTGLAMYGVRTPNGRRNRASQDCLQELAGLVAGQCAPTPTARRAEADLGSYTRRCTTVPAKMRR